MARGGAQPSGLERALALLSLHLAKPQRALPPARDAQRLLGTVDFRVTARPRGRPATVAALYRYRACVARRHLPVGEGAFSHAGDLSGAAALFGLARAGASIEGARRCTSEVIQCRSSKFILSGM